MTDDLLSTVIEGAVGKPLWNTLRALTVGLSIGGPIWAMNGWPAGATFDQTITLDSVDERIESSPFTRPDWRMTFEAGTDTVGNTDTRRTTRCHPASGTAPRSRATCDQMFRMSLRGGVGSMTPEAPRRRRRPSLTDHARFAEVMS